MKQLAAGLGDPDAVPGGDTLVRCNGWVEHVFPWSTPLPLCFLTLA